MTAKYARLRASRHHHSASRHRSSPLTTAPRASGDRDIGACDRPRHRAASSRTAGRAHPSNAGGRGPASAPSQHHPIFPRRGHGSSSSSAWRRSGSRCRLDLHTLATGDGERTSGRTISSVLTTARRSRRGWTGRPIPRSVRPAPHDQRDGPGTPATTTERSTSQRRARCPAARAAHAHAPTGPALVSALRPRSHKRFCPGGAAAPLQHLLEPWRNRSR